LLLAISADGEAVDGAEVEHRQTALKMLTAVCYMRE